MTTIDRISTTKDLKTKVININLGTETLPLFIKVAKWAKIKAANGLVDAQNNLIDDSMIEGAKINLIDYKIVRKDDEWYSAYRDEKGKYEEDKIICTSTITVELNQEAIVTAAKNRILLSVIDAKVEEKIKEQLDASLDIFI